MPFESTTSAFLGSAALCIAINRKLFELGSVVIFLHFVSLCILYKHDVLAAVVEPTDEDKFIKHFWLRACCHRASRA